LAPATGPRSLGAVAPQNSTLPANQRCRTPKSFPPISTVRSYFYDWRDSGLLTTINHLLVMAAPEQAGREASPSAGVIDSRSVKTNDDARTDRALVSDLPARTPDQARGALGAPWPLRYLLDGRGRHPALYLRRHPEHDQHPAWATTGGNMRMTGSTAKSKMLNTGGGKTVFDAWPNHDSGCQDDRLGGVLHQLCNSQSEPKSKKTWRSTLDDLTVSEGNPNGECEMVEAPHGAFPRDETWNNQQRVQMMLTGRILIGAMMIAALGSTEARAWDVGSLGDDGFTFIYDETMEVPYSTAWWGKETGNFTSKAQVLIHAEGKTVFDGTLVIECGTLDMTWTQISEWSSTDSVPSEVWQTAGQLFCSN
jgi:hypothetical protein